MYVYVISPQSLFTYLQLLGVRAPADVLKTAIIEFSRMPSFKAPIDMINCIIQCSKAVTKALIEAHTDGTLPGADELLPSMILVGALLAFPLDCISLPVLVFPLSRSMRLCSAPSPTGGKGE